MHFIRLIRPINLIIIALTMIGLELFAKHHGDVDTFNYVDFSMLVISTILIAAGGNIINDYFDVRADRINKPDKLIISKHIKRRWAIVTHWTFNSIAFVVALYLGWKYQTLWFPIIHLSSITILWWYSVQLKKKPLIGNLFVSFLTSLVVILTLLFIDYSYGFISNNVIPSLSSEIKEVRITRVYQLFILVAFILNVAREIIKDIEDIEGDKRINARTLPMVIGIRISKSIVGIILMVFPAFIIYHFTTTGYSTSVLINAWPISLAALLSFIGAVLSFTKGENFIVLIKNLIKLTMLLGVVFLFL